VGQAPWARRSARAEPDPIRVPDEHEMGRSVHKTHHRLGPCPEDRAKPPAGIRDVEAEVVELGTGPERLVEGASLGVPVQFDPMRRPRKGEVHPLTSVREPALLDHPESDAAIERHGSGQVTDPDAGVHEPDLVRHLPNMDRERIARTPAPRTAGPAGPKDGRLADRVDPSVRPWILRPTSATQERPPDVAGRFRARPRFQPSGVGWTSDQVLGRSAGDGSRLADR
jgi:hypothetical protein